MVTDKGLWLAEFLFRKKRATRNQIEKAWLQSDISYGKELGRRTFQETKTKVEHLFDVNILCDPQTHEYYFEDASLFKEDSIRNWLLKTLSVSNTLLKYQKIQDKILLEEPAIGYLYLPTLLDAMESTTKIELTYHPFNGEEYTTLFSAYCLKVFKQRWYILGYSAHHQQIRTFSLDRIEKLNLTEDTFSIPKEFDNKLYFYNCFGITYAPHLELCTITFKANAQQIPYFRTRPIHCSQQEMEEGIFEFTAYISYELVHELLSYGNGIEVISPLKLRARIKEEAQKIIELY